MNPVTIALEISEIKILSMMAVLRMMFVPMKGLKNVMPKFPISRYENFFVQNLFIIIKIKIVIKRSYFLTFFGSGGSGSVFGIIFCFGSLPRRSAICDCSF